VDALLISEKTDTILQEYVTLLNFKQYRVNHFAKKGENHENIKQHFLNRPIFKGAVEALQ
jgi:hypothetical protein